MEQQALKNVKYCLNTNIYSYLETSDGQSSNLYLNVLHFFNALLTPRRKRARPFTHSQEFSLLNAVDESNGAIQIME
jgi:hypothetical protein